MMPHSLKCRDRMAGGYPCTCDVESWRFGTLTDPINEPLADWEIELMRGGATEDFGPGSMTVVVTFAGGETVTFNDILVPSKGEPFAYKDGGKRVVFESSDTRDPILYEVINPLSIATIAN
jgi:hypothetical protein